MIMMLNLIFFFILLSTSFVSLFSTKPNA